MMMKLDMSGFWREITGREHIIVMRQRRGLLQLVNKKFFELKKIPKILMRRNQRKICQMLI